MIPVSSRLVCLGLLLLGLQPARAAEWKLGITDYTGTSNRSDGYGDVMVSSGEWLAIAAPYKVTSPLISHRTGGRVLLWKRDSATGTWALKQQLVCPMSIQNVNDGFGRAMAMDGGALLVTSHLGNVQSRVHVYRLDLAQDQWLPDGTLTPPTAPAADVGFGTAVALSGDLAAVSAPGEDTGGSIRGGRSHVYQRRSQTWAHLAQLRDTTARPVENQGSSLAFRGQQLLVGSPGYSPTSARSGEGRVIIYAPVDGVWKKTGEITPASPGANQMFGHLLQAVGETAHIAGGTSYTILSPAGTYRFTLPTQVTAFSVSGGWAAVLCPGSARATFFTRRTDQSWAQQAVRSLSTSMGNVHLAGEDLLLTNSPGGNADRITTSVNLYTLGSYSTLVRGTSLIPPEIMRVRYSAFGTTLASSGLWTAVGGPYAPPAYETGGLLDGLVLIYKRRDRGRPSFHSVLPAPVLPPDLQMDRSLLGQQIAVGERWIAVAATRKNTAGYASCPAIVLYQHDAGTDTWSQHSLITAPAGTSDEGFGHSLSLDQDHALLIGAPGARTAYLYQLVSQPAPAATQTWVLQHTFQPPTADATLAYGHSVDVEGDALIIGAPSGSVLVASRAYIYELQDGTWQSYLRTSRYSSGIASFGTHVAISGDYALARAVTSNAESFSRQRSTTTPWLAGDALGIETGTGTSALMAAATAGSLAVIYKGSTRSLSLYTQDQGIWVDKTSLTLPARTYTTLTSLALAGGQLFTSSLSEVLVRDIATDPQVSIITSEIIPSQECLVGQQVNDFYTLQATGQGSVPVLLETTLEGDTADFVIDGARLILAPGGAPRTVRIHFRPQSAGLKQITLRYTSSSPGGAPVSITLQARAVTSYTPLTFTQEPVSTTTLEPLYAAVQGTWPWQCLWHRDGKPIPGATSHLYQPTQAGAYHVVFTNPAGSITSRTVSITHVQLISPPDQLLLQGARSATWTVRTQGPPVRIEWWVGSPSSSDWAPVPDTRVRTTGTTSTLTLPAIPASSAAYTLRVHKKIPELGNGERTVDIPLSLSIVTLPVITSTPWDDSGHGIISPGSAQRGNFTWQWDGPAGTPGYEATWTCTGLPPGITQDPQTGEIGGSTTRLGFYSIRAQVSFGTLKSLPVTRRLVVVPQNVPAPGDYETILEHHLLPQGAHLTLSVQLSGAFSGILRTGTRSQRLAGTFRPRGEDDYQLPSHTFTLPLPPGPAQTIGLFAFGSKDIDIYTLHPQTQEQQEHLGNAQLMHPLTGLTATIPCSQAGRHTAAFMEGSTIGSGFGTITLGKNYSLTFVGTSPEGKGLTASSWSHYSYPDGVYTWFYASDNAGTVLRNYLDIPARPQDRATVHWSRLPSPKSTLSPASIEDPELHFITSRADARQNTQTFGSRAYTLDILQGAFLQQDRTSRFTLSSTLRASFGTGPINPFKARLDIHAPTGFFTGSGTFRINAPWIGSEYYPRTIQFRGMLLPEYELGVGQFLLPGIPDPVATPPVPASTYLGRILISPYRGQ